MIFTKEPENRSADFVPSFETSGCFIPVLDIRNSFDSKAALFSEIAEADILVREGAKDRDSRFNKDSIKVVRSLS